ncbi:MAG: radical SAM protein, partial [Oscillospiraceae bacterium]|nr:radical SAM protein [Oscillospiraceae bacterium]
MKINYLTLMVTTYCTLRCAQCALSIPRIDSAHYPFNDIKQSLVRAFSLYDYVEEFMISGGEAILHPQIIKI